MAEGNYQIDVKFVMLIYARRLHEDYTFWVLLISQISVMSC